MLTRADTALDRPMILFQDIVWGPTPSVPVQDRNRLSGFFPEGIQPQKAVV
jgi:hypothetical protein